MVVAACRRAGPYERLTPEDRRRLSLCSGPHVKLYGPFRLDMDARLHLTTACLLTSPHRGRM